MWRANQALAQYSTRELCAFARQVQSLLNAYFNSVPSGGIGQRTGHGVYCFSVWSVIDGGLLPDVYLGINCPYRD